MPPLSGSSDPESGVPPSGRKPSLIRTGSRANEVLALPLDNQDTLRCCPFVLAECSGAEGVCCLQPMAGGASAENEYLFKRARAPPPPGCSNIFLTSGGREMAAIGDGCQRKSGLQLRARCSGLLHCRRRRAVSLTKSISESSSLPRLFRRTSSAGVTCRLACPAPCWSCRLCPSHPGSMRPANQSNSLLDSSLQ